MPGDVRLTKLALINTDAACEARARKDHPNPNAPDLKALVEAVNLKCASSARLEPRWHRLHVTAASCLTRSQYASAGYGRNWAVIMTLQWCT